MQSRLGLSSLLLPLSLFGCSSVDAQPRVDAPCGLDAATFDVGDPDGHPDPFGAKAAGEARASRIADASTVAQPAHGRQRIEDGDYLLINDKIAVVIEDADLSDGYARFGGEILSIDAVGDDGKPRGVSRYIETLMGIAIEMVKPTSVTVLRDGSDGGEAVVRVTGPLAAIPFLGESPLGALFPAGRGLTVAYDYVLAPHAESVLVRVGVINPGPEEIDFGANRDGSDELFGFFHYSQNHMVTPTLGYAEPSGLSEWVGFDSGEWGFAFRPVDGPIEYGLAQSGFSLFWGNGFVAPACEIALVDRVEIIAGGPDYDGLREAIRRSTGEAPWRAITGTLVDANGAPVEGAFVHEKSSAGEYLSRVTTGKDGSFVIHAPDETATLIPEKHGFPVHAGEAIDKGVATASLAFGPTATLHVLATDQVTGEPLPVRVQVIPQDGITPTPDEHGDLDEVNGRLYQDFAVTGESTLIVPPGDHRVIVSRGYEWELLDTTVTAVAGQTTEVEAPLFHSVDTTGYLCADFHIHSFFSADSNDPVDHKVRGAIADGLDIPVSSEHEWVTDFQPIIEALGLTKWAFGVSSQELTTFKWGHFGVVPLTPRPEQVNAGAVEWIGKSPGDVFDDVHAHPESPALIVNHPSGSGFGGYFSSARLDRETGVGSEELWSDHFDAIEVYNDSDFEKNRNASVADWFALLNHGMTVWSVGSSDSHHLRTSPVGYPRTCMWFGHDDPTKLTPSAVRDAILSGASTISGGPFMTVAGPGGERPGATIDAGSGDVTFTVTVEMPSTMGASTLETIVNGETLSVDALQPLGSGPSNRFVNQVVVKADPSKDRTWVVFHAKGEGDLDPIHPGRKPFAASNPVFLTP